MGYIYMMAICHTLVLTLMSNYVIYHTCFDIEMDEI